MTDVAWVLLTACIACAALLVIALGGDAHLAAENRRLRRELGNRRHPARRPLTLFTGGSTDDGGAA